MTSISMGAATLHLGDCRDVLKTITDASIDAIVTDPPYELGFMGRAWDRTGIAYDVAMWSECLRVLKPGGHLLAFSAARTYHRMACAIEDAGFELRDQIMYLYGSGFPKSFNLDRLRGDKICGCSHPRNHRHEKAGSDSAGIESKADATTGIEPQAQHDVRSLRSTDLSTPVNNRHQYCEVLQSSVPQQGASAYRTSDCSREHDRSEQSRVEGGRDGSASTRELRAGSVQTRAGLGIADGPEGRVCDGASLGNGRVARLSAGANGMRASHGSQSAEKRAHQSGVVAGQPIAQAGRAWSLCGGCGLPVVPTGFGTALKPAHEPICVARKPLVGTVEANVLAHGTGALNVDACRIETADNLNGGAYAKEGGRAVSQSLHGDSGMNQPGKTTGREFVQPLGRWPANVIQDGSDEVLAAFPDAPGQQGDLNETGRDRPSSGRFGDMAPPHAHKARIETDKSAARFFYCAKASRADRGEGNTHPTVKPTDLMAYLCRLVTPPGGTVLDPFMGSGSTGKACVRERFGFVGIDLALEYIEIARARIEHELSRVAAAAAEREALARQRDLFADADPATACASAYGLCE